MYHQLADLPGNPPQIEPVLHPINPHKKRPKITLKKARKTLKNNQTNVRHKNNASRCLQTTTQVVEYQECGGEGTFGYFDEVEELDI